MDGFSLIYSPDSGIDFFSVDTAIEKFNAGRNIYACGTIAVSRKNVITSRIKAFEKIADGGYLMRTQSGSGYRIYPSATNRRVNRDKEVLKFEYFGFVFDRSHVMPAIRNLTQAIQTINSGEKLFIYGKVKGKDKDETITRRVVAIEEIRKGEFWVETQHKIYRINIRNL